MTNYSSYNYNPNNNVYIYNEENAYYAQEYGYSQEYGTNTNGNNLFYYGLNENYVYFPENQIKQPTLRNEIFARVKNAVAIPLAFLLNLGATVVGVISGTITILSGGKLFRETTFEKINGAKYIFAESYDLALKTFNPNDKISTVNLLTSAVKNKFRIAGTHFSEKNNFFSAQIASRVTYAAMGIGVLFSRAIDGMIGVPAAAFSLMTGGYFKKINGIAYKGLQFTGVISDLFDCALKFVNPKA